MRTAVYTRISADQTGERLGVTRQLHECVALADRLGWEIVAHYDDNDVSAYSLHKPRARYEAMLDAMKRGEFNAVLCWHTDRLYRRIGDLERLIEIAEACGVQIRTVKGGDIDLSNSTGRMVARILASVANQESEHKGERQRAANRQKAEAGKWQTANRPFGYTMTGEPLEPEASALRQAVTDILAGKSVQGVAKDWNARGLTTVQGRPWTSRRLRQVLVNPRYGALKKYRGRVVGPGDWTPIIDPDTHRGLVAYLNDPSRTAGVTFERKYLGTGVYRCGRCGDTMTTFSRSPSSGSKDRRRSYVCRGAAHLSRDIEPLDDYVTAMVLEYLSRPDAHLLVDNPTVDLPGLQTKRVALQTKLEDLAAMFAEDVIDATQMRRGSTELRSKLAAVDSQLADATRTSPAAALVASGDKLYERWQQMTPAQRAKVVDEIAVVTVLPCPRGLRRFDSQYVQIEWKHDI